MPLDAPSPSYGFMITVALDEKTRPLKVTHTAAEGAATRRQRAHALTGYIDIRARYYHKKGSRKHAAVFFEFRSVVFC